MELNVLYSDIWGFITAAGQRRACTGLSLLPLVAAHHQNRIIEEDYSTTVQIFKLN